MTNTYKLPPELTKNFQYISKHHAQGNDFIIAQFDVSVELLQQHRNINELGVIAELVRAACDRESGVGRGSMSGGSISGGKLGADGFIVVETIPDIQEMGAELGASFCLVNADGSFAEISGNGLRCVGQAIARRKQQPTLELQIALKFGGKIISNPKVSVTEGTSEVSMSEAEVAAPEVNPENMISKLMQVPVSVPVGGQSYEVFLVKNSGAYSVDVRNPHLVVRVEKMGELGKGDNFAIAIENFMPRVKKVLEMDDVNIEFVEVIDSSHIRMKVYERGVGVTQACGSGAIASVAALHQDGETQLDDEVNVIMDGGTATVKVENGIYSLSGEVNFVELLHEEKS